MSITKELKTIELDDDLGNSYQLVFSCTFDNFMYGTDADGNRGEFRTEMVDYELVYAYLDGTEIKIAEVPLGLLDRAAKEVWK